MKIGQRGDQPQFAMPLQQTLLMLLALGLVAGGAYTAFGFVEPIFLANRYLNGVILGVFLIGVLACFWQLAQIATAVLWIESFLQDSPPGGILRLLRGRPPRLLAPLAGMLGSRSALTQISTTSARSIMDTVASRMDEARDISRYLSSLLIFLGLLGTFFGLAITIPAIVDTIRSLAPEGAGGLQVFSQLTAGLEKQLSGMGTAFSSSLLGLAGSLVVGLLDLFAGHSQNRFYRELEEWISGITKVGFGQSLIDSESGEQTLSETAIAALLEHLTALHDTLGRVEEERLQTIQAVAGLTGSVASLADRIERLTEFQEERSHEGPPIAQLLQELMERQNQISELLAKAAIDLSDEESRMLLRSIDVQLLRMNEDNLASRQDMLQRLHEEIQTLSATIRGQTPRRAPQRRRQEGIDPHGSEE